MVLAEQNKKNKSVLEKIYRDSTASDGDVGAFTPIGGLTRSDYLIEKHIAPDASYRDFLSLATDVEEKANRLYLELAGQVRSQGTKVVRSFEKLAQQKADRKLRLKSLQNDVKG